MERQEISNELKALGYSQAKSFDMVNSYLKVARHVTGWYEDHITEEEYKECEIVSKVVERINLNKQLEKDLEIRREIRKLNKV